MQWLLPFCRWGHWRTHSRPQAGRWWNPGPRLHLSDSKVHALGQSFSNQHVNNPPGDLSKIHSLIWEVAGEPEILRFPQAPSRCSCCWSTDPGSCHKAYATVGLAWEEGLWAVVCHPAFHPVCPWAPFLPISKLQQFFTCCATVWQPLGKTQSLGGETHLIVSHIIGSSGGKTSSGGGKCLNTKGTVLLFQQGAHSPFCQMTLW